MTVHGGDGCTGQTCYAQIATDANFNNIVYTSSYGSCASYTYNYNTSAAGTYYARSVNATYGCVSNVLSATISNSQQ